MPLPQISWSDLAWSGGGFVGSGVNALGYAAFGTVWPAVFGTIIAGVGVLLIIGLGHGLLSIASAVDLLVFKPLRFLGHIFGFCCPTAGAGSVPDADGVVPELRGPATTTPVDNTFYMQLRARGADKLPHHLIIKVGDTAARLERTSFSSGQKYKKAGAPWPYKEVLGATSRRLRELLEESQDKVVHLCREIPCTDEGNYAVHAPAYGYVTAGTDTNLEALVPAPPEAVLASASCWAGSVDVWAGLRGDGIPERGKVL